MTITINDVIKLARKYIEKDGMKYYEAMDKAKKELGYKGCMSDE